MVIMNGDDANSVFEGFNPMAEDYVNVLNSHYYGGPGFALPDTEQKNNGPFNILVENIPNDLTRDGLVRAFVISKVRPLNCKFFKSIEDNRTKAILSVHSITDATNAIQTLNKTKPLNLRVTLVADKQDYDRKRDSILQGQRAELARHLRVLDCKQSRMGDFVNDLCAVENLFKILPSRNDKCFACESENLVRHVHFIASEEKVVDPFEGLPENKPLICSLCSNGEGKFVLCAQCQNTAYCGLRCQALAWSRHRSACSPHPRLGNGDLTHSPDDANIKQNGVKNGLPEVKDRDVAPLVEPEKQAEKPIAPKVEAPKPEQKKPASPVRAPSPIHQPAKREPIRAPSPTRGPEPSVLKDPDTVKPVQGGPSLSDAPKKENGFADSFNRRANNPNQYIEEPDKLIKPRTKISLNEEVGFIRDTKLAPNETTRIIFSFAENPSDFYVQRFEDAETAELISTKLQEACSKIHIWEGVKKLKPGQFCAAMYTEDSCWYRAKLVKFQGSDEALVQFIDFGNTDVAPIDYLRPLPPELATYPALAIHCKLKYVIPVYTETWSKEAIEYFDKCLSETDPPYDECRVSSERDGLHVVELLNANKVSINNMLVLKQFAKHYEEYRRQPMMLRRRNEGPDPTAENESFKDDHPVRPTIRPEEPKSVDKRTEKPKEHRSPTDALADCKKITPASYYHLYKMGTYKGPEGIILYCDPDDPTIIYVLGNSDIMVELCSELTKVPGKEPKIKPAAGLIGVTPADDGDNYRVLILETYPNETCRVFHLDFGNEEIISANEIYSLPEHLNLKMIPAQGIRCRVDNAGKIDNYVEAMEEQIATSAACPITVTRKISEHEYGVEVLI